MNDFRSEKINVGTRGTLPAYNIYVLQINRFFARNNIIMFVSHIYTIDFGYVSGACEFKKLNLEEYFHKNKVYYF